jgi:putative ATP-binding cassette transporter
MIKKISMENNKCNKVKKHRVVWMALLIVAVNSLTQFQLFSGSEPQSSGLWECTLNIDRIEELVEKHMEVGRIPGLALIIVKGDKILFKKGFGYANIKTKQPVTPDTLFELGSNSKAFTALGILLLEEKGLIHFNDPVRKYLPWFKMTVKGREVPITIEQLLHHTSGIPFETIVDIPAGEGDNALEETVKTLVGKELQQMAGKMYSYATINYDVLGLIIKVVSGQSFEDYIKYNVLIPLGLNKTYLFPEEVAFRGMAVGYKIFFKRPADYHAPVYRGNTPAGYVIANANDMGRWLRIQLGVEKISGFKNDLIMKSHVPNLSASTQGAPYAMGWKTIPQMSIFFHEGNNPTFSSFIIGTIKEEIGVAVLANINSDIVKEIGKRVFSTLQGKDVGIASSDLNQALDNISFISTCVTASLIFIVIILKIIFLITFGKKRRKFSGRGIEGLFSFIFATLLLLGFACILYLIPQLLPIKFSWDFLYVWLPKSILIAISSVFVLGLFIYFYFLLLYFFPRSRENA